jgi:cytoskeletal protein CcmA (bactofilin family)
MHRTIGRALLGSVAAVAFLAVAAPASAQTAQDDDVQVVLTGRVEIRAGEQADTVVILDGPAVIAGTVEGAVVALNGDIRVSGTVEDDVVALNGRAVIESGARVGGDVVSSKSPTVDPGATVEGDTRTVRFSLRGLGIFLWVAWWVALTVSVVVLGILLLWLAPAMMAASYNVARNEVGASVACGLLVAIGVPIASVLVLLSLVGIPLGLLGLLSLTLLYAIGFVVAGLTLGRLMVKEPASRYLALLAGLVILRLVGLVPVVGGLITFLASAYGIGAVTIAGWRAARRPATPLAPSTGPAVATPA